VIRVAVADDQALFRAGFQVLLEPEEDLELVGEAGNGAEAVELTRRARPDVVLMDMRMPVMDGIEATRAIAADQRLAGVRVVILTTYELDEYIFEGLRAGASGFLVKDTEPVELLHAIRVVAAGEGCCRRGVTRRLIAEFAAQPGRRATPPPELGVLTEREQEVMALVAEGLSNQQIAVGLVVSPATVRTHISRAMIKLHARDRAQLVVFAYQSGLVRPGWSGA
jgi:DNA-binding NarL/FixJ family response regulator